MKLNNEVAIARLELERAVKSNLQVCWQARFTLSGIASENQNDTKAICKAIII